jgi:hypothetical protein
VVKYICSNHGGKECHDCKCNKPHAVNGINPDYKYQCAVKEHFCTCAMDDMSGGQVQCYPVN